MGTSLALSGGLSALVPADPPAPGLYLAAGPRLLPSWFLSALLPALGRGGRVFWIDAGNDFNAYGASYAARSLGYDPKPLLARVSLARPFNLYQLRTMVCGTLPKAWRGEPVVVSDPMGLFYDEDVPAADAKRVFDGFLRGMKSLAAVWLVLSVERKAPEGRAAWAGELARQAQGAANLRPAGPAWLLERARG